MKYYAKALKSFEVTIIIEPLIVVGVELSPAKVQKLSRTQGDTYVFSTKKRRDEYISASNREVPGATGPA